MSSCRRELCIGLILNSITYRSLDLCIPTTFSIAEGQDLITYVGRNFAQRTANGSTANLPAREKKRNKTARRYMFVQTDVFFLVV